MTFAALECDRISIDLVAGTTRERAPRFERELAETIDAQLAGSLLPYVTGRDDGVRVFIEKLEIGDAIGGRWEPDAIVRRVARRIAAAVSAELDGGGGMRFRDRAEFVAAFIVALAEGAAWSRWHFDEFAGLRPMSPSNAIRSVVLAEGAAGFAALARLTAGTARGVLATLRAADAARIVLALRARVPLARPSLMLLWRESAMLRALGDEPAHWLGVLLACERAVAGSAGEYAVRTLLDMRQLRELAPGHSVIAGDDPESILDGLRRLAAQAGRPMEWIETARDGERRMVATELAALGPAAAATTRRWTPFGGAFLLLACLARLGWLERWGREAEAGDCRLLAFAVITRALAPRAQARAYGSAELLAAFGVDDVRRRLRERRRDLALLLVETGTARTIGAAARELLAAFAASVPGLAGSTHEYLRRNVLDLAAAIEIGGEDVRVIIGRAPLDVLLTLSGLKRGSIGFPGGLRLRIEPEAGP